MQIQNLNSEVSDPKNFICEMVYRQKSSVDGISSNQSVIYFISFNLHNSMEFQFLFLKCGICTVEDTQIINGRLKVPAPMRLQNSCSSK